MQHAGGLDLPDTLSVGSKDPEEETVQGLKRKLEDLEERHNALKEKAGKLEADYVYADTQKKALTLHVHELEKQNKKLEAENESLRVTKRHMIAIPSGQSRPNRGVKATRELVEGVDERYVGIGLHIESLFSAWAVKEVAELQHFCKEPRRNWSLRGDEVTECGISVAGGKLVAPIPPHSIAKNGKFFMCSSGTEEHAIKNIMEEELKGDQWKTINATEESRKEAIQAICKNSVLRLSLKRCLSDTASYKKRVARDSLFTALNYDKLISKNAMKNEEDLRLKAIQINEAKHKLMKKVAGTNTYDMSWWRRCEDDQKLSYGYWEDISAEQNSQSVRGIGAQSSADVFGEDEEGEEEEMYGLFRNDAAKTVWAQFVSHKVWKTSKEEEEEDGDDQKEVPESSILQLARMDAWIMTVLDCLLADEKRGGKRQKLYVDTFQKFLPIAMGQLSEELYDWVKYWAPDDLATAVSEFDIDAVPTPGETKDQVFSKTYEACIPVYVPTAKCAYLAIRSDWFTTYVGDELGKVYDCYIAEFSEDYSDLKKLSGPTPAPASPFAPVQARESFADSLDLPPPLPSAVAGTGDVSGVEPAN